MVPIALYLIRNHLHFFVHFVVPASHEPLDREDRVLRIGDRLPLRDLPHQALARLGKSHHRRSSPPAFFIRNDLGLATFHHSHHRVGGAKVNSDNLCHVRFLLNLYKCIKILRLTHAYEPIIGLECGTVKVLDVLKPTWDATKKNRPAHEI